MANKLYPKTKAKIAKALLDLSSVTIKLCLVETNYTYSDAHEFLSDIPSAYQVAISPALTGQAIGASDASFQANSNTLTAVTGSSAGEHVNSVVLFHDTGNPATSELIGYFDTSITGVPFVPSGADETVGPQTGATWFTL